MRSEVYSWRLSSELKSELEREARQRKISVSSILETAVRNLLKNGGGVPENEDEEQRRLRIAAERSIGILASGESHRAETARDTLRKRLRRRRVR